MHPYWLTIASASSMMFPILPCCFAQRVGGMLAVPSEHDSRPATELHAFAHDPHQKSSSALVAGTLVRTPWLTHGPRCLTPSLTQLSFHSHTAVSRLAQVNASCTDCTPVLPAAQIQAGTLAARFTSLHQTSLPLLLMQPESLQFVTEWSICVSGKSRSAPQHLSSCPNRKHELLREL